MTEYQIVALYAALNLILVCVLMVRVGQVRMAKKVSLGDGGNDKLLARIRTHGNYIENAPLALIGLLAMASLNVSSIALHIFGVMFLIGRLLHAHGMTGKNANGAGRGIGMGLTMLTFLGTAGMLIYTIFTGG